MDVYMGGYETQALAETSDACGDSPTCQIRGTQPERWIERNRQEYSERHRRDDPIDAERMGGSEQGDIEKRGG